MVGGNLMGQVKRTSSSSIVFFGMCDWNFTKGWILWIKSLPTSTQPQPPSPSPVSNLGGNTPNLRHTTIYLEATLRQALKLNYYYHLSSFRLLSNDFEYKLDRLNPGGLVFRSDRLKWYRYWPNCILERHKRWFDLVPITNTDRAKLVPKAKGLAI